MRHDLGWWRSTARIRRSLGVALVCCAVFATSAYAGAGVWLNWVWTNAWAYQFTDPQHLKYVEAEALHYGKGCANAWNPSNGLFWFKEWSCAPPEYGALTPYIPGTWLKAHVWNRGATPQYMWGWQSYY